MPTFSEKAKQAWGDSIPVWIINLANACDETSQATVAKQLPYGAAVVNQVLQNKYKGNLNNVKTAVEGAFMSATVNCPILGKLASNDCMENQRRPFAATNSQRVRLYKVCRTCQNNQIGR